MVSMKPGVIQSFLQVFSSVNFCRTIAQLIVEILEILTRRLNSLPRVRFANRSVRRPQPADARITLI